jgi:hypothetical protein
LDYFFAVEVKNIITRTTLGGAIQKFHLFKEKGMLVARYITPQIADELKKMDIPFMDVTGNAYINEPPAGAYISTGRTTSYFCTFVQSRSGNCSLKRNS